MPMTLANAKIYVARIVAGGNVGSVLDMAGEAIQRAYQEWEAKQFWRFLLKDTSKGFTVPLVTLTASATVNAPSAGAFDGINVGVTVTDSQSVIPASTTVSSITYNTDGTVATIVLSAASAASTGTCTLTISGDIPIIAGTRSYNLPTDFNAAFGARFLTNPHPLTWKDVRAWDRTIVNQTVSGYPQEYTTYNPYSDLTQAYGQNRLMFDVIPASADVLNLKYYRSFVTDGTYIDMPDQYLYMFLDYARARLLETKRAQDDPAGYITSSEKSQETAAENDAQPTDDDDADQCLKSQYESGYYNQYDPYRTL